MSETKTEPKSNLAPFVHMDENTGLVPRNLGELRDYANMLSSSGLIPKDLQGKPSDVMVIIMTGATHDLNPIQALNSIYVVHGRASMSAQLMVALCLRASVCDHFDLVQSNGEIATYEAKRAGRPPIRMSYTIEEARKAGYLSKDNWQNSGPDMLRARAASKLARAVFPDIILGMYTPDEIRDDIAPEPRQAEVIQEETTPTKQSEDGYLP